MAAPPLKPPPPPPATAAAAAAAGRVPCLTALLQHCARRMADQEHGSCLASGAMKQQHALCNDLPPTPRLLWQAAPRRRPAVHSRRAPAALGHHAAGGQGTAEAWCDLVSRHRVLEGQCAADCARQGGWQGGGHLWQAPLSWRPAVDDAHAPQGLGRTPVPGKRSCSSVVIPGWWQEALSSCWCITSAVAEVGHVRQAARLAPPAIGDLHPAVAVWAYGNRRRRAAGILVP